VANGFHPQHAFLQLGPETVTLPWCV